MSGGLEDLTEVTQSSHRMAVQAAMEFAMHASAQEGFTLPQLHARLAKLALLPPAVQRASDFGAYFAELQPDIVEQMETLRGDRPGPPYAWEARQSAQGHVYRLHGWSARRPARGVGFFLLPDYTPSSSEGGAPPAVPSPAKPRRQRRLRALPQSQLFDGRQPVLDADAEPGVRPMELPFIGTTCILTTDRHLTETLLDKLISETAERKGVPCQMLLSEKEREPFRGKDAHRPDNVLYELAHRRLIQLVEVIHPNRTVEYHAVPTPTLRMEWTRNRTLVLRGLMRPRPRVVDGRQQKA